MKCGQVRFVENRSTPNAASDLEILNFSEKKKADNLGEYYELRSPYLARKH